MKINLSQIGKGVLDCLRKFPSEASLGLYFVVVFILQDQMAYDDRWRKELHALLPLLPAFYVFTYSLNVLCQGKIRMLYWLSPYLFVPILLWVNLEHFTFTIAHAFTLVLSLFVLLACKRKWDNREFANISVQTFVDLVIAFFVGHVLALAVLAIYASVVYIFDFDWGSLIQYLYIAILFLFIPLTFCQLQDKKTEYTLPRFIEIIVNYILSPGVVIYTGILYLYIIVIAVHWELPKGGIGYMVLAFIAVSMAGRMAQLIVSKQPFAWFYDRFSWIALPPLALFWIGSLERITTYSFTESRVYLLASGVLTTLYVLFLFSKRFGTYQLMALISIGCIVVLTFVPGISAKSIGISSQTQRMKYYIQKLDMMNDSTYKLKPSVAIIESEDSIKTREFRELQECYNYLRQEIGSDRMLATYGPCNITINDRNKNRQFDLDFSNEINIRSYSKYIPLQNARKEYPSNLSEGILTIQRAADDKTIILYNIDEYMNTHVDQIAGFENYSSIHTEPLVYRNDSCMLLINNLSYEIKDGKYHCTYINTLSIFMK